MIYNHNLIIYNHIYLIQGLSGDKCVKWEFWDFILVVVVVIQTQGYFFKESLIKNCTLYVAEYFILLKYIL